MESNCRNVACNVSCRPEARHNRVTSLYQNKYRVESARLHGWDYRSPGWYFVTICTQHHICILGNIVHGQVQLSRSGKIADSELYNLICHYVNISVDDFILMPNHIHATDVIDGQHCHSPNPETYTDRCAYKHSVLVPPKAGSLSAIVRSYKASHPPLPRNWSEKLRVGSRLLRSRSAANTSLQATRDYIEKNPANWPPRSRNLETLLAMFSVRAMAGPERDVAKLRLYRKSSPSL
jgi:putative transposase